MIGTAPEYTKSKYFRKDPTWHLTEDAPKELKAKFELDINTPETLKRLRESYPEMSGPVYSWSGKVIDRGGRKDSIEAYRKRKEKRKK